MRYVLVLALDGPYGLGGLVLRGVAALSGGIEGAGVAAAVGAFGVFVATYVLAGGVVLLVGRPVGWVAESAIAWSADLGSMGGRLWLLVGRGLGLLAYGEGK